MGQDAWTFRIAKAPAAPELVGEELPFGHRPSPLADAIRLVAAWLEESPALDGAEMVLVGRPGEPVVCVTKEGR
jgi:hypothetical protein